eukprot:2576562-Rhodomonas_salina.1
MLRAYAGSGPHNRVCSALLSTAHTAQHKLSQYRTPHSIRVASRISPIPRIALQARRHLG